MCRAGRSDCLYFKKIEANSGSSKSQGYCLLHYNQKKVQEASGNKAKEISQYTGKTK